MLSMRTANGLLVPIALDRQGRVLDGRNRLAACAAAGVEPRFRTYEGDDEVAFVVSMNLRRRHLDEGQRGMVAARLATLRREDTLKQNTAAADAQICATTQDDAAELLNVARRTVQHARVVLDRGTPELVRACDEGRVAVSDAAAVARLAVEEQRQALAAVDDGRCQTLRRAVALQRREERQRPAEGGRVTDLWALVERGITFGTIYADPPWLYDNQATRAATANHYDGMTVDELVQLPVGQLGAADAHLHLWTTNGFLFDCPRLLDAWGFTFKSSFVLVKTFHGTGNYWRNAHEILLTAVRGDARRFNDHSLRSWLECERGKHSGKPEQVRAMIERASPGPYLELFARGEAPNGKWLVWGDQIAPVKLETDR